MDREQLVEKMARRLHDNCVQDEYYWGDNPSVHEYWKADARAALAAIEAAGFVVVDKRVVAFLNGDALLDNHWFDDGHPEGEGRYWWRKYLAASPLKSVEGK